MAAPLTEAAIEKMRDMIATGDLAPGARLPPEQDLATLLGASRNTVREAVRALVTARVLDVRRGDGTYVTSLRPELLLEGIAFAAELLQADFALELIGVRRILEPAATAQAALRIDELTIARLRTILRQMRGATDQEVRMGYDVEFHGLVAAASGNSTLASMLAGVSKTSIRARVWRGIVDDDASSRTLSQHQDILRALESRDPVLAQAAALVHVATTEAWLRRVIESAAAADDVAVEPRRGRQARSGAAVTGTPSP